MLTTLTTFLGSLLISNAQPMMPDTSGVSDPDAQCFFVVAAGLRMVKSDPSNQDLVPEMMNAGAFYSGVLSGRYADDALLGKAVTAAFDDIKAKRAKTLPQCMEDFSARVKHVGDAVAAARPK